MSSAMRMAAFLLFAAACAREAPASAGDFARNLEYMLTYHWGGLSPYGDDDSNMEEAYSLDFDDVFGQPKGHASGGKLTFMHKGRFGLRLGYETTNFRTTLAAMQDSAVEWKVRKHDMSTELLWGKPFGGRNNNFFPYVFGGLSYVRYGEALVLTVQGREREREEIDQVENAVGLNLGGGVRITLARYVDLGVEVWRQGKGFQLKMVDDEYRGVANEINGRLLLGIHLGPFPRK